MLRFRVAEKSISRVALMALAWVFPFMQRSLGNFSSGIGLSRNRHSGSLQICQPLIKTDSLRTLTTHLPQTTLDTPCHDPSSNLANQHNALSHIPSHSP